MIDKQAGRWFSLIISPKVDGREMKPLTSSASFQAAAVVLLNRMAEEMFPDRDSNLLRFPDMVFHDFVAPEEPESGIVSFHVSAVSQRQMQSLSQHQWMQMTQILQGIAGHQARLRQAPAW